MVRDKAGRELHFALLEGPEVAMFSLPNTSVVEDAMKVRRSAYVGYAATEGAVEIATSVQDQIRSTTRIRVVP